MNVSAWLVFGLRQAWPAEPVGVAQPARWKRHAGRVRRFTGADIIRDQQRAWLAFRDKKCDAAGLPMEGGTGAGLLAAGCVLQETARQAIWLDILASE